MSSSSSGNSTTETTIKVTGTKNAKGKTTYTAKIVNNAGAPKNAANAAAAAAANGANGAEQVAAPTNVSASSSSTPLSSSPAPTLSSPAPTLSSPPATGSSASNPVSASKSAAINKLKNGWTPSGLTNSNKRKIQFRSASNNNNNSDDDLPIADSGPTVTQLRKGISAASAASAASASANVSPPKPSPGRLPNSVIQAKGNSPGSQLKAAMKERRSIVNAQIQAPTVKKLRQDISVINEPVASKDIKHFGGRRRTKRRNGRSRRSGRSRRNARSRRNGRKKSNRRH